MSTLACTASARTALCEINDRREPADSIKVRLRAEGSIHQQRVYPEQSASGHPAQRCWRARAPISPLAPGLFVHDDRLAPAFADFLGARRARCPARCRAVNGDDNG